MSRRRPARRCSALRRPRYAHHVVLLMLVGLALLPIYFMVVNAFKTDGDYLTNQYGPPSPSTFDTLHGRLPRRRVLHLAEELVPVHDALGRASRR